MNRFREHIPNFVDGIEPKEFEFLDLDDLSNKLGVHKSRLVYDDDSILKVSEDETWWWTLGRVASKVEGLRRWQGAFYEVIEVETIHGWGLDTFKPKAIGKPFQIRSRDIRSYSSIRESIVGELKNGKPFVESNWS